MIETIKYSQIDNLILPYPELNARDICMGADPFVFKKAGLWHLLLATENTSVTTKSGIEDYVIHSASSISQLKDSQPVTLKIASQSQNLKEVWAAEIHFDKYLYVAASDGNNKNHRMYVYKTEGDTYGPWKEIGLLSLPIPDDCWAIDMTWINIPQKGVEKTYAVWSGWQCHEDEFPQHLYIAEMITPTQIGQRHLIASPDHDWCLSVAPILEGPQSVVLDGKFIGLTVAGNASWTRKYNTRILKYDHSGNPLDCNSWKMAPQSLFKDNYGIGHGMIMEEGKDVYYIGHRKTSKKHGWEDRVVFYSKLNRKDIENYLNF